MGNLKQRWTPEEEDALRAGVYKHGTGKWKVILTDPEFASFLANRSNIDLKDKWRNLCVSSNASGSRERVGTPRLQGFTIGSPSSSPNPVSAFPLLEYDCTADPSESSLNKKIAPKYDAMIFEAVSSMKDNGPDVNSIHDFIEERHELPPNFRRFLTSRLRRLVLQGKLEKIDNCFKIKDTASGSETPKHNDAMLDNHENDNDNVMQIVLQGSTSSGPTETLEDAASYATYKIAESENKSYMVADACAEADRIRKITEETEAMLLLAEEIYEKCLTSEDGLVILSS